MAEVDRKNQSGKAQKEFWLSSLAHTTYITKNGIRRQKAYRGKKEIKISRNVGWTLICLDIKELMKVIKSDRKLKSGNMRIKLSNRMDGWLFGRLLIWLFRMYRHENVQALKTVIDVNRCRNNLEKFIWSISAWIQAWGIEWKAITWNEADFWKGKWLGCGGVRGNLSLFFMWELFYGCT